MKKSANDTPDVRRYDGLTLDEWQARMTRIDPGAAESTTAVPGLMELVADESAPEFTRRQAALTLGRIGEPASEAIPLLTAIVTEQNYSEPERIWAGKALALFGPVAKTAAPSLIETLEDTEQPFDVRQTALEAVAQIGVSHPRVIPALIQLLSDPGTSKPDQRAVLQRQTADAIALVGPEAAPAIPALLRLAAADDETVRRAAVSALGSMGGHAEIAVSTLAERMVFDESPAVRDAAGTSLAGIGAPALPVLLQFLSDTDEELRWRAAVSLTEMGTQARPAREPLAAALDDESARVRLAAAEALLAIDANPAVVLPTLVGELANNDRQLRLQAYRLLVGLGAAAHGSLDELRKLSSDERSYVRQAATRAIEEIESAR